MIAYLDSSVALRYILAGDPTIHHVTRYPRIASSELLEIECRRAIHRARLQGELTDEGLVAASGRLEEILAGIDLLALSDEVKARAKGSFPVVIRTLDALHLGTVELLARAPDGRSGEQPGPEEVLLFSFDRGMNRCAVAMGFAAPLASATPPTSPASGFRE